MVFSVKNSLKKRSKQLYGNVVVIRVLDLMGLTFLSLRKLEAAREMEEEEDDKQVEVCTP